MAKLAIRGHATRGKEVIEILKMLGGVNKYKISDANLDLLYTVRSHDNFIVNVYPTDTFIVFTLEEFLEKFPYKVGDKVTCSDYESPLEIVSMKMKWKNDSIMYEVYTNDYGYWFGVDELKPYKEESFGECIEKTINDCLFGKKETIENNSTLNQLNELDSKTFSDGYEQGYDDGQHDMTEWNLPDGFIFKDENGNVINTNKIVLEKKKPKYPKTYEECCEVLSIAPYYKLRYHTLEHGFHELATSKELGLLQDNLNTFGKLLICRNAYWKIAGEKMGLGKSWEPDFTNNDEERYGIYTLANKVEKDFCGVGDVNTILVFPTEEMRDAFSDSKEIAQLIEICKEFL